MELNCPKGELTISGVVTVSSRTLIPFSIYPTMKSRRLTPSLRQLILAQLCLVLSAPFALAQTAPATDAATLAQYDKNKAGKLEADETAAMQADQAKAAGAVTTAGENGEKDVVVLSPLFLSYLASVAASVAGAVCAKAN